MTEMAHDHGHPDHEREGHAGHQGHRMGGINSMAASATLHCLTGCAIGEIAGLIIGTAAGRSNAATIVMSIALAFVFGFSLSSLPLSKAGLTLGATLSVSVADTAAGGPGQQSEDGTRASASTSH